jgi:hypothetical protein
MANQQRIIGPLFSLIGIGLLLGAIAMVVSTMNFRTKASATQGVVVDMIQSGGGSSGVMYKPVYEYQDQNGRTHRYTPSASSNPPAHRMGERMLIYFDPQHPEEAAASGFMATWFLPSIFGFLGTIFAAIGFGLFFATLRTRRIKARLAKSGRRIQARYTGTERNHSIRVNGRSPWRLTAQWQNPSSGRVHVFESENIWYDPSEYVHDETLDVMINPRDPGEYYLDVDFLPKQA